MRTHRFLRSFLLGCLSLWVVGGNAYAEDWSYRIREGENLSILAARYLKPEFTAAQLQDYNGIVEDRNITVGTDIRIPIEWMKDLLAGVRVSYVQGVAKLRHAQRDEWIALKPEMILQAGDRVMTGPHARISVLFADGSSLQIGENSEVVFDVLSAFQGKGMLDTQIHLQRGRLENQVVPLIDPKSRYEIHTPAAVTVVRGTAFRVRIVDPSGGMRTEVNEGRVGVSAQGESLDLSPGEGVQVMPGDTPGAPHRLLPKADLNGLVMNQSAQSLQLDWPDLAQATHYRIRLIDQHGTLVYEGLASESQSRLPLPERGRYVLGIRGIDEQDWEGLEAKRTVEIEMPEVAVEATKDPVAASVSAPLLDTPQITPGGVRFRWTETPGAWAYRLQLTRDPEGNEVLFERLGFDLGFEMAWPVPPFAYVRVQALTEDTDRPLTSRTVEMRLPRLPW